MFNSDLLLFYSVKCMQYYMWIVILFLKSKKIKKTKNYRIPIYQCLKLEFLKFKAHLIRTLHLQ